MVEEASAAQPPAALIVQTVRTALRHAGEIRVAVGTGALPANVAALASGELAPMATVWWKPIALVLLLGGGVATGVVSLAVRGPAAGTGEVARPGVASEPQTSALGTALQAKAEGSSLLANGDVEEGAGDSPAAWTVGASIPGVEYIWSRDTGHTHNSSLCLKKTARRYFPIAQWSQIVERKGEAPRLKVSAWVKAEQASKAILDAQFINGEGETSHVWVTYIGARKANDKPVSHGWKRYQGIVAIPPKTKQIVIAPQIYGPGTVWFDDLEAEYTSDPATDAG
jgi:RNA polymerase sigma-70 factor (ECF subfamily)